MSILASAQMFGATAAITLLVGCSGGSTTTPQPLSPQSCTSCVPGRGPSILGPMGMLNIDSPIARPLSAFYACPANGPIKYVAEFENRVIDVYVGKFAGQAPCGQIMSGISHPQGMFVKHDTHDLYVANAVADNVVVFHRGELKPYNVYVDPTYQSPLDVTVAKDGTVIASNIYQPKGTERGSISTWIGGPHGGTFIGNFPMTHDIQGGFITAQSDGTIYYDDEDATTGMGALWTLSCPAGVCGAQTRVIVLPGLSGGLGSDVADDLLAINQYGSADTFEFPNKNPSKFPILGIPFGMAVNELDHHLFVTDVLGNDAAEYLYPSGILVGTVIVHQNAYPVGIAVDPGHVP